MDKQLELFKVSEIKISYQPRKGYSPKIQSSHEAFAILLSLWDIKTIQYEERFVVLYLNRNNAVLGVHQHSIGGISGTIVDIRQVFGIALKANAVSIMLCHNHPSQNLQPSSADKELTKKFQKAGKFLEIEVLDHLIISNEGYFSFADEEML